MALVHEKTNVPHPLGAFVFLILGDYSIYHSRDYITFSPTATRISGFYGLRDTEKKIGVHY